MAPVRWVAAALAGAVVTLCGCATSVPGQAVRASSPLSTPGSTTTKSKAPLQARDLLLQNGESTPYGMAVAIAMGDNYFTSALPAECTAAVLFKGSPLRPPDPVNYAESAYESGGVSLYAESIGVYEHPLNQHDVVWNGFNAVSGCHGEATPVSPQGESLPMQLSFFSTPSDGVLVWTMTRPDWICEYGLAVVSQAALLMSACNREASFSMAEWAAKRRAQIDSRA